MIFVVLTLVARSVALLPIAALIPFAETETVEVMPSGGVTIRKRKKKKKAKDDKASTSKASRYLQIGVDSLGDPIKPGSGPSDAPRADGAVACSVSTMQPSLPAPGAANGKCTLRSAIETANGLSGGPTRAVVVLRPGRFRLNGRLPDITGNVELRGADMSGLPPPVKRSKAERRQWSMEQAAAFADADDYKDRGFEPRRPGTRQLAPVTSTIDGGKRFQILRTAYGSRLRVSSVRFEFGMAIDEDSAEPRAALGGAICASGNVTLNNSVVRSSRAINGGGLYTEGKAVLRHSVLADNWADHCGGLIYTAGQASISECEIHDNKCGHFDCKKQIDRKKMRSDTNGDAAALPSWRKPQPKASSGGFGDDDDDDDADGPSGDADASGAIAEGPPLTGPPTVEQSAEEIEA